MSPSSQALLQPRNSFITPVVSCPLFLHLVQSGLLLALLVSPPLKFQNCPEVSDQQLAYSTQSLDGYRAALAIFSLPIRASCLKYIGQLHLRPKLFIPRSFPPIFPGFHQRTRSFCWNPHVLNSTASQLKSVMNLSTSVRHHAGPSFLSSEPGGFSNVPQSGTLLKRWLCKTSAVNCILLITNIDPKSASDCCATVFVGRP